MPNVKSSTSSEWKVLFSIDLDIPPKALRPCILISPKKNQWDNFGFKTDCLIRVYTTDEFIELSGKLAFIHTPSSYFEKIILRPSKSNIVRLNHSDKHYTQLIDAESYRQLIRWCGLSEAKKILSATNDMAFAKATKCKDEWFIAAQRERAFTESFIRTSEAFFAFSNSSFLADGLDAEKIDAVSNHLKLNFKLDGFSNNHNLDFTFDKKSLIPRNISIIIGRNGVGKSRALFNIVEAALKNDLSTLSGPNGERPMLSRILALATPGETEQTFPRPRRSSRQRISYRRLSSSRGANGRAADDLADLVHQLARSEESIRNQRRWELFVDALRTCIDINSIAFQLHPKDDQANYTYEFDDVCCASLNDFDNGNEARRLELRRRLVLNDSPRIHINGKLHPMSSGQISFFRFALHACLYIENGTLVLLDEPETHLHPNLISDFAMLLNTILANTGSIAIISTHSAYFVREVPRSQVHILRIDHDQGMNSIICEKPRLGTFGSNVGAISHFVFDDNLTTSLMRLAQTNLSLEDLENIKDEISLESYMKIRDKLLGKV